MYPVWVIRNVSFEGFRDEGGWYCRKATLPIPPFIGLGLPVDKGVDPVDVKFVWIDEAGGVVVQLEDDHYEDEDDDEIKDKAFRDEQLRYLTAGWERINLGTASFEPFESGPIPW